MMNRNLYLENGCSYSICPLSDPVILTPIDETGLSCGSSIVIKKEKVITALVDVYNVDGGEFTITLVSERGQSATGNQIDPEEILTTPQTIHVVESFPVTCQHGQIYLISADQIQNSLEGKVSFSTDRNTFATCEIYITVGDVAEDVSIRFPNGWITADDEEPEPLEANTANLFACRVENINGTERVIYNPCYKIKA